MLPASPLDLTYTDSNYGFSVMVPADWDTSPLEGLDFDAQDPTFVADFNIFVEDLASIQPPLSLDQYFTLSLSAAQSNTPEFKEVTRGTLVIAGTIDAWETAYTYDDELAGPQEGRTIVFIRGDLGFTINAIVNEGCESQFRSTLDAIIASFTFATN